MQQLNRKTQVGRVVSKSGDKSLKVAINFKVKHPKYGKYVRRRSVFGVHDERNEANVGDLVEIAECRPRSKTKNWRLAGIAEKVLKE